MLQHDNGLTGATNPAGEVLLGHFALFKSQLSDFILYICLRHIQTRRYASRIPAIEAITFVMTDDQKIRYRKYEGIEPVS